MQRIGTREANIFYSSDQIIFNGQTLHGSKIHIAISRVIRWVCIENPCNLHHITHLTIVGRNLQSGLVTQCLLEAQLIIDRFFRLKVWVWNHTVNGQLLHKVIMVRSRFVSAQRSLRQHIIVSRKHGRFRNRERECNPWHHRKLGIVILERSIYIKIVRIFDVGRGINQIRCNHTGSRLVGYDARIRNLCSFRIVPGVSIAVSQYFGRVVFVIHINGKCIVNGRRMIDNVSVNGSHFLHRTDGIE